MGMRLFEDVERMEAQKEASLVKEGLWKNGCRGKGIKGGHSLRGEKQIMEIPFSQTRGRIQVK